jgi:hypothetical protein
LIWAIPSQQKGRHYASRTGLAIKQRNIVPRFEMADIARKIPFMFSNNAIICNYDNSISIGAQRDFVRRIFARHGS